MTDVETLKALRERVLGAREGDCELDRDIGVALGCVPGDFWWRAPWSSDEPRWAIVPCTFSIDAALALVERCRPMSSFILDTGDRIERSNAVLFDNAGEQGERTFAETLPLAILAALLSALIAQKEGA